MAETESKTTESSLDPIRALYVQAVEDAQAALEKAQKKLEAFDLLADDLRSGALGHQAPRPMKEKEVEDLLPGMAGTFTYKHLPRYLAEFEFRYNARFMNDGERMALAISWAEGKRLMYRSPETRPQSFPPFSSYGKGLQ